MTVTVLFPSPDRKTKPGQVTIGSVEALARAVAPGFATWCLNRVSPGTIDTPMVAAQGDERAAIYAKVTEGNIIPGAGTTDEVAQAIIFLVQNDFVAGTTIDVDAGGLLF